jgi:hypothetical protein
MPGKTAIQAVFRGRAASGRKPTVFLPPVAISVRTRRMFAIPFAINLGSVAMISRWRGISGCNQRAHGSPMFAIPTADVCRSLHVLWVPDDLGTLPCSRGGVPPVTARQWLVVSLHRVAEAACVGDHGRRWASALLLRQPCSSPLVSRVISRSPCRLVFLTLKQFGVAGVVTEIAGWKSFGAVGVAQG